MVLLPSRRNIRDIIIRYLNDFDIPSQADREGGLLDRPQCIHWMVYCSLLLDQMIFIMQLGLPDLV